MIAAGTAVQPIVVRHVERMRFDAQVRSHHVRVDQTKRAGGDDSAPTPLELLGVALGTCIAHYITQFLVARHLEHEGLEVRVEQQRSAVHTGIGAFVLHVHLPMTASEQQLVLLERVVNTCPVHHTLQAGVAIQVLFHQKPELEPELELEL